MFITEKVRAYNIIRSLFAIDNNNTVHYRDGEGKNNISSMIK